MKKLIAICASLILLQNIEAQNNVGIGTTTPQYRLDLVGRQRIQAGTLNNASTSPGIWHTDYRNNVNVAFVGMADSVNYGFWGDRPGIGWQFFFDARYGNVGIGRKPNSGQVRLALDHPDGAALQLYSGGGFSGSIIATDTTLNIASAYGTTFCIPNPCPAKDLILWPSLGRFSTSFPGNIGMYTDLPKARIHISSGTGLSGVLIGGSTSVPAIGYMLSVDGKIICEELKVQLNASWPDYVFEETYDLKSIDELEQQVMQQKHLPGIPSAANVKAEQGIEIGDMQKRLLEKVEELYRYVFELNNENKKLKAALKTLTPQ